MEITIRTLDDIPKSAEKFLNSIGNDSVFAFYGDMGAGKTTFIKAVCEELGVRETVSSPTFAIINEYTAANGAPIYHFDFYRIRKLEEVYDFGYEEYFYSGELCFIEWPELIEEVLPDNVTRVVITEQEDGIRVLRWPD